MEASGGDHNTEDSHLFNKNKPGDRLTLIPEVVGNGQTEPDGTNPEDESDKKEEKKPRVGLLQLFRYSDKWDMAMIFVASVAAAGSGLTWPMMMFLFARCLQKFVNHSKYEHFLERIQDFIDYSNMSRSELRKDVKDFIPHCPMLDTFTNGTITCEELPMRKSVFDEMEDDTVTYVYCGSFVMVCSTLQYFLFHLSSERQVIRMRLAFYRNVMRQEMAWFDSNKAGELAVKLSDDISKIHDAIGERGGAAIQWLTSFVVAFGLCFYYGWELSLIMQIGSPVLMISTGAIGYLLYTMTSKERVSYGVAGAVAEEVFSAIRTVQAFGGEEKEAVRYIESLRDATMFGIQKSMVIGAGQGIVWLITFSNWGLGFWYGGMLVRHGDYSVKDMIMVFFNTLVGAMSLGFIVPSMVAIVTGRGAAHEVFYIIDRTSVIDSASTEGLKPSRVIGDIHFNSVSFSYPSRSSVQVLSGLDLHVSAGQSVAVVGASGCGKSTLVQLMLRFYDTVDGQIFLDGNDIRAVNIKWLRQSIGLVGQEPVLFPASIADNIRYGQDGATDEQIIQACKDANAYNFIMNMPDKLETYVGERGAQLSGGQKQRIAIARALVKNPTILLLDEATSALDSESEAIVQDALDKASKGRTTIIIAHRLSTIQNADLIVVVDKGKIAEKGTHSELLAAKGLYHQMVSNQLEKSKGKQQREEGEDETLMPDKPGIIRNAEMDGIDKQVTTTKLHEVQEILPGKEVIKRLLKLSLPEWRFLILGCVACLINGAVQPVWSVVQARVFKAFGTDDESDQKDTMREMAFYSIGIGLLSLVTYFLQEYMFGLAGEALSVRLRNMLFRAMLRQDISWFDNKNNETGVLTARLATDVSTVQSWMKTAASNFMLIIGDLATAFIISYVCSWQLALSLTLFVPFVILAGALVMKSLGGTSSVAKAAMEEMCKDSMVSIDNVRTVAALTKEEMFNNKFKEMLWLPFWTTWKTVFFACFALGFSQCLNYIAFAVCFYYGADLLKDDKLTFDDIFKVLGCLIISGAQLGRAVTFATDFGQTKQAAEIILSLHDKVPSIDAQSDAGLKPAEGTFKSTLRFSNIKFRYPNRQDVAVLNGLELGVEQGQTLALTGESGCGKSTTVQLVERFYDPNEGGMYLDTYNIKELNVKWLRSQIGLVSQEPMLFDRSVGQNIAYGDNSREVSMDEIIKAAKSANVHNFIQSLPLSYDTNVGSKGTQLSGGQKQRIAIARALVRNPKILLLDEATSALDTESEAVVQEALDKARQGRTCITIAHRLSTIRDADKIAVFQTGVVQESGTHVQLVSLKGLYYGLLQRNK